MAAVASDLDLWWVFFVGVVNVAPVIAGEMGDGNAWDPTPDGLNGDLLRKAERCYMVKFYNIHK